MLILPVYLLFLGAASAAVGLYGHRLVAALGLVPHFDLSFTVTAGVACVFATLQLAYVAFLRFFFPSRDAAPLITESFSLAAAALLAPIFLGLRVPLLPDIDLPSAIGLFGRADNLVFLGCFLALHLFFKLMTLFAATRTVPTSRLNSLYWIAAGIGTAFGAQWCFLEWRADLFSPSVVLAQELPLRPARSGEVYAAARLVPEGTTVVYDIEGQGDQDIVFRFALPQAVRDRGAVFASIAVDGRPVSAAPATLDFEAAPWAEVSVPTAKVSPMARECTVRWSRAEEAAWLSQIGFHAPPAPDSELLVSGPRFHPAARSTPSLGVVVVAIDGLGAADVRGARAERPTTPELFALSERATFYENAFSPAPESPAACMTLLTGLDPLKHGFLDPAAGPVPQGVETVPEILEGEGFVTAAFTEGLPHGSGFERGFDLFSVARSENGAADTLKAAGEWAEAHRGQRYFLFVRLTETAALKLEPRHGTTFLPKGGESPGPQDLHDNALVHVDRLLGDFIERLDSIGLFQRGCLVVAGTHGLDLSGVRPGSGLAADEARTLREPCLHVPLWVLVSGRRPERHAGLTPLARVAPMVLEAAEFQGRFNGEVVGRYGSLLGDVSDREVVSVAGDPVVLSMRTGRWRFTWQSGRSPFSGQNVGEPSVKEFFDMHRYAQGLRQDSYYNTESRLAESYREQLEAYLEARLPAPDAP